MQQSDNQQQMNGRRVSLMQDCTLDKKPQAYNLNG